MEGPTFNLLLLCATIVIAAVSAAWVLGGRGKHDHNGMYVRSENYETQTRNLREHITEIKTDVKEVRCLFEKAQRRAWISPDAISNLIGLIVAVISAYRGARVGK
jgi:hypothetical protein